MILNFMKISTHFWSQYECIWNRTFWLQEGFSIPIRSNSLAPSACNEAPKDHGQGFQLLVLIRLTLAWSYHKYGALVQNLHPCSFCVVIAKHTQGVFNTIELTKHNIRFMTWGVFEVYCCKWQYGILVIIVFVVIYVYVHTSQFDRIMFL